MVCSAVDSSVEADVEAEAEGVVDEDGEGGDMAVAAC